MAGELLQVRESRRAHEVCEVDLVAELVDLYDTVPGSLVEGAERLLPSGHDGTPLFAEFLTLELAALLRVPVGGARGLVSDVMDLRERLPRTWAAMHAGAVEVWQARKLAQLTGGLEQDACLRVDELLCPALGRIAWPRVLRKARGLIVTVDPTRAAAQAEARRKGRFVLISHDGDGMSSVYARVPTAGALVLANAIDAISRGKVADGFAGGADAARADALVELATPGDGVVGLPRPEATVFVHLTPQSEVARTELRGRLSGRGEGDLGPVLVDHLRDLLGHHRVRLVPVLDVGGDESVDAYEIPDRLRRHVDVRDGWEVFPWSATPAWRCEKDHTVPWPRGATRPGNLASLSKLAHRGKTHGGWRVEQPEPGCLALTSPLGFEYRQSRQGAAQVRVTEHIPARPLVVDLDFTPRRDLRPAVRTERVA